MAIRDNGRGINTIMIGAILIIALIQLFVLVRISGEIGTNTAKNTSPVSLPVSKVSVNTSNVSYFSQNATFGQRLTNISDELSPAQLSTINSAPNSYFERAGEMLLNGEISNPIFLEPANKSNQVSRLMIGGKPTVVYIGAISCVYCGESRWAMALALSRFGSFSKLYKGYSSFGDYDIPTIYWIADNYTTQSGVGYGNSYTSSYINFISADYESPIVQGFDVKPLSFFIKSAPNATYLAALSFMNNTSKFDGTPFTLWGNTILVGADAAVFGNSTPSGSTLQLTGETHSQVINQLQSESDQFSLSEYAAADVYGAYLCASLNTSNVSFCSLPAIEALQSKMNLT